MGFLKTDRGHISSRWIVRFQQRPQGDYLVEYSNGGGAMEAIATADDLRSFHEKERDLGR